VSRRFPSVRSVVFFIGCIWALYVWLLWPITPHRDYMSALGCAILMTPAYLLVSLRRCGGYAMRAFVVTAVAILVLSGTRIVPGRIDLIWVYICIPPASAIFVGVVVKLIRQRKSAASEPPRCAVCEYDLHGNVSGVCPECGTPVRAFLAASQKGDVLPGSGAEGAYRQSRDLRRA